MPYPNQPRYTGRVSEPPILRPQVAAPWSVVYCTLHDLDPGTLAPDDPIWGWFTQDQLAVRHPDGRTIDVGWYPDCDPTGRFRLLVVASDSARDWLEPLHEEELATPRAVEEAVLRICGGVPAPPAPPAPRIPEEVGYAAGSEYDPGDPFGLCTLTVTAAGAVRLVNRQRGRERVFEETAADWVFTTLRKLLDDAGFPSTPRHPIPAGPTRMLWTTAAGERTSTPPLAYHEAATWPEYRGLFYLLDCLVVAVSDGALPVVRVSDPFSAFFAPR